MPAAQSGTTVSLPLTPVYSLLEDYNAQCETGPCLALPHQQVIADVYRLDLLQQAAVVSGWNFQQVTDTVRSVIALSPYWSEAYTWGQLLATLPEIVQSVASGQLQEFVDVMQATIVDNLCVSGAVAVRDWSDEEFVQFAMQPRESLCRDYRPLETLGFVAYHYVQEIDVAVSAYRLAALSADAPRLLFAMPALLETRYGDPSLSVAMWYVRALTSEQDYDLRKMVDSYILASIGRVAAEYDCGTSIQCVQEYMSVYLREQQRVCQQEPSDLLAEAHCFALLYGIQEGYLSWDGRLDYPLGDNYLYGWRDDVKDWWIVPVE